ncbi:hypothetical protein [Actinomycetospora termitidis]|uniref:Uncharacterized protein n=1 Tax=Actinomycetospora termitidis TaxID=3053470 RepID=A0ABT7MG28_9PSEU|nr:hypothetical protein [Actinomycetospora sp. Odt1-22]MDL5159619.1 hypothetical protein [Actinomycetospora sp. Odt1-22]
MSSDYGYGHGPADDAPTLKLAAQDGKQPLAKRIKSGLPALAFVGSGAIEPPPGQQDCGAAARRGLVGARCLSRHGMKSGSQMGNGH